MHSTILCNINIISNWSGVEITEDSVNISLYVTRGHTYTGATLLTIDWYVSQVKAVMSREDGQVKKCPSDTSSEPRQVCLAVQPFLFV